MIPSGDILFPMGISMIIVKNPNALGPWEMERQVNAKPYSGPYVWMLKHVKKMSNTAFCSLDGSSLKTHLQSLPTEIS